MVGDVVESIGRRRWSQAMRESLSFALLSLHQGIHHVDIFSILHLLSKLMAV
jgi:hypothetical protein